MSQTQPTRTVHNLTFILGGKKKDTAITATPKTSIVIVKKEPAQDSITDPCSNLAYLETDIKYRHLIKG